MKRKYIDKNAYGIIGLGRFGMSVALELVRSGKQVVVLDNDEEKLNKVKDVITRAHLVSFLTPEVLKESGVSDCGTVIISIGSDIESNILATLNVIESGVPRVISKAMSDEHGRVLEKIGAEVILPESDSGLRLARSLVTVRTLDFLELESDISITEIPLPEAFIGKTLAEVNLRGDHHLNIIAITREEHTDIEFEPEFTFEEGDELVVVGKNEMISRFMKKNDSV